MLSDASLGLMRDVFEKPALFSAAHRITRRVVQWGRNAVPVELEHSAAVVSERELLGEVEHAFKQRGLSAGSQGTFMIFRHSSPAGGGCRALLWFTYRPCRHGLPAGRSRLSNLLGRIRRGWQAHLDPEFGRLRLASRGWRFTQNASSGEYVDCRTNRSITEPSAEFSAKPAHRDAAWRPGLARLRHRGPSLRSDRWGRHRACGPRSNSRSRGGKSHMERRHANEFLRHYEARLILGFQRHLTATLSFYRSGHGGPWWDGEVALLRQGVEWCARQMHTYDGFRYQLRRFDLMSIDNNRP
jgi:hypothetical protein